MTHLVVSPFIIILLFCSINQVVSEAYYIKANSAHLCNTPCQTLSQFVMNSNYLLNSNITITFLPGRHILTANVTFSNREILMNSESSAAQIVCTKYSHFTFSSPQYIHISNLEFIGCGGNQVIRAHKFILQDTIFMGQENGTNGTALELIRTSARIINCTFSFNVVGQVKYFNYAYVLAGGAIVANNSNISITQSLFAYNRAVIGGAIYAELSSTITVSESTFIHNTAVQVAGVLYSTSSTITIYASAFRNNSANNTAILNSENSHITIGKCAFSENTGGLLSASTGSTVLINTSYISNNSEGVALLYFFHSIIIIDSSKIDQNTAAFIGAILFSLNCTVTVDNFYN